jgi:hypothetical protein
MGYKGVCVCWKFITRFFVRRVREHHRGLVTADTNIPLSHIRKKKGSKRERQRTL